MRRLHIANIANMAFNYADILNQHGLDSTVLCYDLNHFLSTPESNLGFTEVPDWYHSVKTSEVLTKSIISRPLPSTWIDTLQRFWRTLDAPSADAFRAYKPYVDAYEQDYLRDCDLIYGYAYGAVPPLLYSERKYIPVDLGSLRGLSTKTDDFSKLLKISFAGAPCVVLTNPDVLTDCKALGIERYVFIPHPIDEEKWSRKTRTNPSENAIKRELNADFVIVAPARHDWSVKGSDEIIRGIVSFSRSVSAKVVCILVEWGGDLNRSKALISDLNAEDIFFWTPLLSESQLKSLYDQADALIDQIGEAVTFGLTTPKAMSAGIPVLTCFDRAGHEWCYDESPPLIDIVDSQSLSNGLLRLYRAPAYAKKVVDDQLEWINKHHSKKVIVDKFLSLEDNYLTDSSALKVYFRLNTKRTRIDKGNARLESLRLIPIRASSVTASVSADHWAQSLLALPSSSKVLFVGCGSRHPFPAFVPLISAAKYAIDISPDVVEAMGLTFSDVTCSVGDVDEIPFPEDFFDFVLCYDLCSHGTEITDSLKEIRRVIKPGGHLIGVELNLGVLKEFASAYPRVLHVHAMLQRKLALNQFEIRSPTEGLLPFPLNISTGIPVLDSCTKFRPSSDFSHIAREFGALFFVANIHHSTSFYETCINPYAGNLPTSDNSATANLLAAACPDNLTYVCKKDQIVGVSNNVIQRIEDRRSSQLSPEYLDLLTKHCDFLFSSDAMKSPVSHIEGLAKDLGKLVRECCPFVEIHNNSITLLGKLPENASAQRKFDMLRSAARAFRPIYRYLPKRAQQLGIGFARLVSEEAKRIKRHRAHHSRPHQSDSQPPIGIIRASGEALDSRTLLEGLKHGSSFPVLALFIPKHICVSRLEQLTACDVTYLMEYCFLQSTTTEQSEIIVVSNSLPPSAIDVKRAITAASSEIYVSHIDNKNRNTSKAINDPEISEQINLYDFLTSLPREH